MLLAALAFATASPAAVHDYAFDSVHSQLVFHVSHLGFSTSEGEFHGLSGGFSFDRKHWEKSHCDVQIDVHSLDLDDAAWEKALLGKIWFDVKQFPTMHFVCDRLELIDANHGRLHGRLTIRGIEQALSLELTFNRAGIDKYSLQYVAGFSATTELRRSDFGMLKFLPDVGDLIAIELQIEGIRRSRAHAAEK
jgi:polyisoprenoid-binding protein YceI